MSSASVSTFATSKRTACDRCHAMKLRCPARNELGMQPCSRCVRAGAECVLSYSRPLGWRARLNIPPNVQTNQFASDSSSPTLPMPETLASRSHRDGSHGDSTSSVTASPQPTTPASRQLQRVEPLDLSDDFSFSTLFGYQDEALLSYGVSVASTSGSDARALEPALDHAWLVECFESYTGAQISQPPEIQCDPDLSGLNHELSQQLDAWNQRLKLGSGSMGFPHGPGERSNSMETDVLQAMSKLEATGQRYQSRPSIIIILQLLTAYLQVVALCNHLFIRLQDQLEDTTETKSQPMQSLPGLQLAGVTVQQGELQTKILVQAILHYFQAFERALSLPPELCLYKPQIDREGLLDQDLDQALIKALLDCETAGIQGLSSLASLRQRITQVRRQLSI